MADPIGFVGELPAWCILRARLGAHRVARCASPAPRIRRRQASGDDHDIRFHHFRDRDGIEVDVVLERGAGTVAGVEVKAGATVTAADFRGRRTHREGSGGGELRQE
jgi:hypothetical protein